MKRFRWLTSIVVALSVWLVIQMALAQGITLREGQYVAYKFEPRTWDFGRPDGRVITVMIDTKGTLTVLEDQEFLGLRYDACALAE